MNQVSGTIEVAKAGKYLTFTVSKERYGIDIVKVQEIIKIAHITFVPKCPSYLKGVINLRGKIIPVIDLRLKFGIEPIPYDDKTCIIVINMVENDTKLAVGLIVDTVLEVIDFAHSEIEPAPRYGATVNSRFIIGMGKRDNLLNILIDIEHVVSDGDVGSIGDLIEPQAVQA